MMLCYLGLVPRVWRLRRNKIKKWEGNEESERHFFEWRRHKCCRTLEQATPIHSIIELCKTWLDTSYHNYLDIISWHSFSITIPGKPISSGLMVRFKQIFATYNKHEASAEGGSFSQVISLFTWFLASWRVKNEDFPSFYRICHQIHEYRHLEPANFANLKLFALREWQLTDQIAIQFLWIQ